MLTLSISTSPELVGSLSTITFQWSEKTSTSHIQLTTGDTVTFTLPAGSPGTFSTTATCTTSTTCANYCSCGTTGITVTACTITSLTVAATFSLSTPTSGNVILNVFNFQNPTSRQDITPVTASHATSGGTVESIFSTGIITNFVADVLLAASITPNSQVIGQSGVTVTISFTPKTTLTSSDIVIVSSPYWNPYSNSKVYYFSGTPVCTNVQGMSSSFTCVFNQLTGNLQINNPVSSSTSGSALSFTVTNFINPYSGVPITGFTITTGLPNTASVSDPIYAINELSATVQVSTFATLSEVDMSLENSPTTVESLDSLQIYISVGLPVEANCYIMVYFPSNMPVTSDLTSVTGINMFSTISSLQVNTIGQYASFQSCPTYSESVGAIGQLNLNNAKAIGYVDSTSTFVIEMFAINGGVNYKIASMTSGEPLDVSQFEEGDITSFALSAVDSQVIQATTKYQLTILPQNSIPTNSQIVVTFPSSITLTNQAACTIITGSTSGGISTSPGGCTVSSNVLTLTNAFGTGSYVGTSATTFAFTFSVGGTNPLTVEDAGNFTIETFAIVNGSSYPIDYDTFDNVFTPLPDVLGCNVTSSSYQAFNEPVSYTFSIRPAKVIPVLATIEIVFPTQVNLQGSAFTSCSATISGVTSTLNNYQATSTSPLTLEVEDAFPTTSYTSVTTPFTLTCSGIQNPRTESPTSTFQVSILDQFDAVMMSETTGIYITMTSIPSLTSFSVVQSSLINGASTTYVFTVVSPLTHYTSDYILFTFPSQITMPTGVISCAASTQTTAVACSAYTSIANTMKVIFTYITSPLAASTAFSFSISGIINPPSTQPSNTFTAVQMFDTTGVALVGSISQGSVTDTTPASVVVASQSLTQGVKTLSTATTYTITYLAVNPMPSGSAFMITLPSNILASTLTTCFVTYLTVVYTLTSCSVNGQVLSIGGGFSTTVIAGGSIAISFGPITNPPTQLNVQSLQMISYTTTAYLYSIDQIVSGLTPSFACSYPCDTCLSAPTTACLTCLPASSSTPAETHLYLYNQQCLTACPTGTYNSGSNICVACPSVCLTCSSSTVCTSCTQTGAYPFLYLAWCYATCPNGLCPNAFSCGSCVAATMSSVTISPNPTVINSASILTFTGTLGSGSYATGDTITYTVPSPGSFTPGSTTSLCSSLTTGISITSCVITANTVAIKISVSGTKTSFQVAVSNFINPPSTYPISTVSALVYSSAGTAKALYNNAVLTGFTPAVMTLFTLTPQNLVVGASDVTLSMSLTIKNSVPSVDILHMIDTTIPNCAGVLNVNTVLTCSYSLQTKILTVTGILSAAVAAGSVLTFTVDNFLNPYSAYPKTGFYAETFDSSGGAIDLSAVALVTVTQFAALSYSEIDRYDATTEIQANSVGLVSFEVPVPVEIDCVVRIDFPSNMPMTSAMVSSTGSDMMAGLSNFQTHGTYFTAQGCTSYTESGGTVTMTLNMMQNIAQVEDTTSFTFSIYAQVGGVLYAIAQQSSGIILSADEFTEGTVTDLVVTGVTSEYIQESTTYSVSFLPEHGIPTSSLVMIDFPASINLTSQTNCSLLSPLTNIQSPYGCTVSSNVLTLTNAFGTGSYSTSSGSIKFTFSLGGTNPTSAVDAGAFTVATYAVIAGQDYPIDSNTWASGIYTPTPYALSATITPGSYVTSNSPTTYTATLTPQKIIPSNGHIFITLPTGLTYSGSIGCTINTGSGSTNCACTTSGQVVSLLSCLPNGYSNTNTPFTVTLSNIVNPRTTATTGSFTISTTDLSNNIIESKSTGLTVTMTSTPSLNSFTISPTSSVNGVTGQYKFTISSNINTITGDQLVFTFPVELPLPASPTCTAIASAYIQAISCSKSGNTLTASLTFTPSPLTYQTPFSFYVNSMTNPPSTKPTSAFTNIQLLDSNNNQISTYSGTPTVTDQTPSPVTSFSLQQGVLTLGATTSYSITYTNINAMPVGSCFSVPYPATVSVTSPLTTCYVKINGVQTNMGGCTVSGSSLKIQGTSGGIASTVSSGASIVLGFGPVVNPSSSQSTSSLTMTSYTDNTFSYSIDTITNGLIPSFLCTYPCKTCPTGSMSTCSSCFTSPSTTYIYLYNSQCITSCPTGTYIDSNNNCITCPTQCATCASATSCTTCNTASTSSYPVYSNSWCYSVCPDGSYNSGGICTSCNPNCKTCNITSTTCTSCMTNTTVPYLQASQCVSSCTAGTTGINYNCTTCTSPCATCSGLLTQCSSCTSGKYLYGTTCVSTCPSGTVISSNLQKCLGCDPKCLVCSSLNQESCLTCQSGYLLLNDTCYTACPNGYQSDLNGTICSLIIYNTSSGNSTEAIGTGGGTVVDLLESGNGNNSLIYFPTLSTQTVLGGVSGGASLASGSSLALTNAIGMWGPLEFISIGGQVYLALTHIAANSTTTNSTTTSTRRLSGIVIQNLFNFNGSEGAVPLIFWGTCFAILSKIICNLIFMTFFLKVMRHDPGYIAYRKEHCATPTILFILGSILSFKLGKFFYSKFFGHSKFHVQLDFPERMHNTFTVLTVLNIVLTLLPIIFCDIYGLIVYKWGSQFYIMMIETLVLCVSMLVVQIWEFYHNRKHGVYNPQKYEAVAESSIAPDDENLDKLEEFMKKKYGKQYEEMLARMRGTQKGDDDDLVNKDDQLDNCYFDVGLTKKPIDESLRATKVIQGNSVQSGEEYEGRERMHQKDYGKIENDDDNKTSGRRKNKMRGRKGKYYSQVDDEDQSFLNDQHRDNNEEFEEDDDEDDDNLHMIEEESVGSAPEDKKQQETSQPTQTAQPLQTQIADTKLEDQILKEHQDNMNIKEEENKQQEIEEEQVHGEMSIPPDQSPCEEIEEGPIDDKKDETDGHANNNTLGNQSPDQKSPLQTTKQPSPLESPIKESTDKLISSQLSNKVTEQPVKDEKDLQKLEEEIAKDEDKPDIDGTHPKFMNTKDMQKEIEKEMAQIPQEEMGEPDSDDDDDKRIANMTDPDKKRFNVNDILGELDRDEKGNIVLLQNKQGNFIDKKGERVNPKGYLIDENSGDVVEKEKHRKVFDHKDLDERGELPPPFNLERFNFNAHDVRGYFDRDADGFEIIGTRKNSQGDLVDKQGRVVNKQGYLVDKEGNLVDKRGRIKLHKKIMEESNGDIPLLYNYKGKKFDLKDVMGHLDKDRNGNIILRRDKDNNTVDKKGRRVNNKGYLIDKDGNVINEEGKIMFEAYSLSVDNEIPKLFPFLKFNIEDIKGEYEMDPLGNPMLSVSPQGFYVDLKGKRVNEKGYLLDDNGNVKNKRGFKVFNRMLLEEDGDIPKIFRTGLLRKDTYDSFSQLMSEIEDLERLQEMDENDPRRAKHLKNARKLQNENDRIQKRIDQIVEEDNDDDDQLMKELEELANNNGDEEASGGNTSVDSQMEDTPSNYNVANQRFNELEEMKTNARKINHQRVLEEDDFESEYSYMPGLPGRKMKKKKKKKKKKVKEVEIDERELMMAKAYGGLSQAQIDKLIALKRAKMEKEEAMGLGKPPMAKIASNSKLYVGSSHGQRQTSSHFRKNSENMGRLNETDWAEQDGNHSQMNIGQGTKLGVTSRDAQNKQKSDMNLTTSRLNNLNNEGGRRLRHQQMNNLVTGSEKKLQNQEEDKQPEDRDRRLSNIANSVNGFYREPNMSEHSKMNSTHESNFASNIQPLNKKSRKEPRQIGSKMNSIIDHDKLNDPELERIYGTARGLADMTVLSDWEKDSGRSGGSRQSSRSQFQMQNTLRVRGLENIYLQRLEPANKGRSTAMRKKGEEKAKFRVMHHKYHEEPAWHVDDQRDELDSVISDNYKYMEKKFVEEFQPGASGKGKKRGGKDKHGINIFHGRLNQYKEVGYKKQMPGVDLSKSKLQ